MCLSPNMKSDSPNFNYYRHCASHELFHIMYQELVWEKLGMKRIIWFDEGWLSCFLVSITLLRIHMMNS